MPKTTKIENKPILGKIIAGRLKEKGETQRQLARNIGMNYGYLYCIISGRAKPSLIILDSIAFHLELDVGILAKALLEDKKVGRIR